MSIEMAEAPLSLSLDLAGNLYIGREAAGIWRVEPYESKATLFSGAGNTFLKTVGQKEAKEDALIEMTFGLDASGCPGHVLATNYWSDQILKIDTATAAVEVLSGASKRQQIDGSIDTASYSNLLAVAAISDTTRPRILTLSAGLVRVLDVNARTVSTLKTESKLYRLFHPSLLRPFEYNEMSSILPLPYQRGRNAWAVTTDQLSVLLDLDSGSLVPLHSAMLYPLVTFSPQMTLAIEFSEELEEAWIVLVDWSLSSAHQPPHQTTNHTQATQIRRIAKLPGKFKGSMDHQFVFSPKTNQLYSLNRSKVRLSITRYSNVLRDLTSLLYRSTLKSTDSNGTFLADALPLLNCSHFPGDISILHGASLQTWNAHSEVLKKHTGLETLDKIKSRLLPVVRASPLPYSSIDTFMRYLHFSRAGEGNSDQSFVEICNCVELCQAVGLDTSALLYDLSQRVVAEMSDESLVRHLLERWNLEHSSSPADASKMSTIMIIMARRVHERVSESEAKAIISAVEASSQALSTERSSRLNASLIGLIYNSTITGFKQPESFETVPNMRSVPLKWDETLSLASMAPLEDSQDFVFGIEGLENGGVICKAWLLYAQWTWFQRLVKSKLEETESRRITMPSWVSPRALIAILAETHGSLSRAHLERLEPIEMQDLIEHSSMLHLDQSACFAPLLMWCRENAHSNQTNDHPISTANDPSETRQGITCP